MVRYAIQVEPHSVHVQYMIYLIMRKTWQCVSTNDVLKVRNGLITSLSVYVRTWPYGSTHESDRARVEFPRIMCKYALDKGRNVPAHYHHAGFGRKNESWKLWRYKRMRVGEWDSMKKFGRSSLREWWNTGVAMHFPGLALCFWKRYERSLDVGTCVERSTFIVTSFRWR